MNNTSKNTKNTALIKCVFYMFNIYNIDSLVFNSDLLSKINNILIYIGIFDFPWIRIVIKIKRQCYTIQNCVI